MKILAFGASSSSNSINQKFAIWAAHQIEGAEVVEIDLRDYEMPLYSIDRENGEGVPEPARKFKKLLAESDGVIISFAEHNGSYAVVFKNVFDWMSRLEKPIWLNKAMFLLATSPGGRGAQGVLMHANDKFPYQGATISGTYSLPFFSKNFSEDGILDGELRDQFFVQLSQFEKQVQSALVAEPNAASNT